MDIQKMKITELKAADYNPRKHLQPGDPEYEKLKRSLTEYGYVEPVIWNRQTGNVVGGHQRLTVLRDMGETEVDVVVVDLDMTREKALNVALNKISGDWDLPKLSDLLKDIGEQGIDVTLTGFDVPEIEKLFQSMMDGEAAKEDNFDVDAELQKPSVTKKGDLWLLGRHRLLCGDSTSLDDVSTLMGGEAADLLLTDPPYNVAYEGKTKDKLKIANDKMKNDDFRQFLRDAFTAANSVMKPGAAFYIWHADSEGYNFRGACFDTDWKVRQCLVWVKQTMVMGRQDYQWKHEPCLYGWKDGGAHVWCSDRKQTTVLEFDRPSRNKEHPTMKPIPLFDYQIKNSTRGSDRVLDLFGGSGTTIMACEQNGRIGYSMELDEKYCDVIVNRYIELVGSSGGVKVLRDGLEYSYAEVQPKE